MTGKNDSLELCDLSNDPGEAMNLADGLTIFRDSLYVEMKKKDRGENAGNQYSAELNIRKSCPGDFSFEK